jgi:hypothetical protein
MQLYKSDVLERMWKERVEAYLKILLTRVKELRKITKDINVLCSSQGSN